MPGRMGGDQRTVKNVWVYKIDPARNLMWVKGQVIVFIFIFALNYEVGAIEKELSYTAYIENPGAIPVRWRVWLRRHRPGKHIC